MVCHYVRGSVLFTSKGNLQDRTMKLKREARLVSPLPFLGQNCRQIGDIIHRQSPALYSVSNTIFKNQSFRFDGGDINGTEKLAKETLRTLLIIL